jgi:site-specific recombinase XerD
MTVEVILYNYRKNKSGVYPLYVRLTENRKRIYRATGISVRERDWNRRRREPTVSCPNREEIMLLITTIKKRMIEDKIKRYEEEDFGQVKPNKPGNRYLSLSIGGTMSRKEFYDLHQLEKQRELICLFDDYIQQLKEDGELEYISGLTAAKDAFAKVNGYAAWGIPITGITKEWLRKAEKALLNDGENKNTVEGYIRALRIVYDYAVEKGLVTRKDYPFPYHENFTSPLETVSKKLVARLFDDFIQHIKEKGGSEYISGLTAAKDALIIANGGNLNIPITDVTKAWLRDMDEAMLKSGVNKSLVERYMVALKAVYEYAIEKGLVTREDYPFPYHENFTSLLGTISERALVARLFDDRIEQLEKEDQLGNASRMKIARSAFAKANGGNLNFPISEITEDWLRKMEKTLFESGVKSNTVETYMRALRAIYNIAIKNKLVSREDYPFGRYIISELKEETEHRALSPEDIQKIKDCPGGRRAPAGGSTGDESLYVQFA